MKERSARACQACRVRKVKCNGDGEQDCFHCVRLGLKCSYPESNPDSRLRRATVRGSLIQACLESESEQSVQSPSGLSNASNSSQTYRLSTTDTKFFLDLVPHYCGYILPSFPIVSEDEVVAAIGRMNESQDDYVLVNSIAAATWTTVGRDLTHANLYLDQVRSLYTRALDARGHLLSRTQVTVESIMVSAFLAKCLSDAEYDSNLCYYYLRDAVTRLQLLRIHDPHVQAQQTHAEQRQRVRAYWLLFIQERFDALSNFRPAVLSPLPDFPEDDISMPAMVNAGFVRIIEIFRMVDAKFIENRLDSTGSSITIDWIREKQAELGKDIQSWEENISYLSLVQQVDLGVTRHWLRALVWQMTLQLLLHFPESRDEEDGMSVLLPVRLSQKLRSLLSNMPRQAVEIHSTGILYKIFEIAAISADVLEHVISRTLNPSQQTDHIDNFVFLSRLLLGMPHFNERALLESRLEKIRSLFSWYFEDADRDATTW